MPGFESWLFHLSPIITGKLSSLSDSLSAFVKSIMKVLISRITKVISIVYCVKLIIPTLSGLKQ